MKYRLLKKIILYTLLLFVALFILIYSFLQSDEFGQPPNEKARKTFMTSKNYDSQSTKFRNKSGASTTITFFKGLKLLPKFLASQKESAPKWDLPIKKRTKQEFQSIPDSTVRLTWFGHSAFLLEIDGQKLLLDPMLGPNASPVSFFAKRFHKELPIEIDDLPDIDAVLLSHDHYDHLDYYTIMKIKDKVGHFYVPLGVGSHLEKWGIDKKDITELDWWQDFSFNNLNFICTPAQHFSGRSLNDRDKTLWVSWVIKSPHHSIFFSGDGGYFDGFKKIGEKFGPFDLCMLECGQYNLLWKNIHMMPEETVQAGIDLKGKLLVPIHWGAFSLALHAWDEPIIRFTKEAQLRNIPIATPMIGESIVLEHQPPTKTWWVKPEKDFNK